MAKLQDLYTRGNLEKIVDDEGREAEFYLKKLNPVDAKTCLTKSNASRARFLTAKKDKNSDDYMGILSEVLDMDEEELYRTAVSLEVAEKTPALEEELKAKDKWSKDDYLESIQEEWEQKSKEVWISTRPDSEGNVPPHDFSEEEVDTANRIYGELSGLRDEADKLIDNYRKRRIAVAKRLPLEEVQQKAVDALFEKTANATWVEAFYRWQLFYSVYHTNKKDRYFDSIDELFELSPEVYTSLLRAYRKLEIDQLELKS